MDNLFIGFILIFLSFCFIFYKISKIDKEESWDELNSISKSSEVQSWGLIAILIVIGLVLIVKNL